MSLQNVSKSSNALVVSMEFMSCLILPSPMRRQLKLATFKPTPYHQQRIQNRDCSSNVSGNKDLLSYGQSVVFASIFETAANVATSLAFIGLGMQAPRKNLSTKVYANSIIGVGIASSLYHASRGKLRKYLRWLDYTMIATTTILSSVSLRALSNEIPKLLMAVSAVALPFQPLMVSTVHTRMMEVAFAKRSLKDPDLKTDHNVQKLSSWLGADDFFPETPFLHAGWHLAAAIGVGTCNKLLE